MGLASALAGPNGAAVVAGSATVQGQGTASVVVNQSSQNAIINWNTFNIGAGETTTINMPSKSSTELNRVTGGLGPSEILGSLTSNGQVFLVNPDGILFGKGAQVNVGSFLATTHDIANADFMAGRFNFTGFGNPAASIVNQGTITAQTGGFAALVAPGVRNTGTITATLGQIGLASANAFALDFYGDRLIQLNVGDSIAGSVIDVSTGKPLKSLVSNEGTLKANGGRVELTAVAARQVVDSVINNTGVIEANSIGTHNGMIVLQAATAANKPAGAPTQTVKVSGTLSAAGKRKGTTGGTIEVTGENVQLSGANINVSGRSGGGTVLIGGDWGGGNPNTSLVSNPSAYLQPYAVPTATTVSIDSATLINASATKAGNGGKVIVWSNDATTFYGSILAQGGAQSGGGGFVETSGHQLSFSGLVNTSAPNGQSGTLLLDPLNATIAATAGSEVITVSSITNALATGNVVVTTVGTTGAEAGDITVAASLSWANANTLTLNAYHDININSGVTIANTGAGNLVLRADATGTGTGTVNFLGTGNVDFSLSTGTVSIFYNPADNPAGSVVNATSYTSPFNYSPYVLTNSAVPGQLAAYMLVNSVYDLQNIENNLSGVYALGTNIDASATASWNSGAGFVPIGNLNQPFLGTFDGQYNSIENLRINFSTSVSNYNENQVALFGAIDNGASIRRLNVADASISSNMPSGAVAILVASAGYAYGNVTISDVTVSGTITAAGGVGGAGTSVGGVAGFLEGSITRSSSSANISVDSGTYSAVGDLVGFNNFGSVTQSYATGNVTAPGFNFYGLGGLVGADMGASASVSQSYATGQVAGGSSVYGTGGLVGGVVGSVTQSYAIGAVSGTGNVGGLVGGNGGCGGCSGVITTSYTVNPPLAGNSIATANSSVLSVAQLQASLPYGFDASVWGSNSKINNGYPYLLWTQVAPSPPPTILTPTQLQLITVDANPETKVYGSADPTLSYTIVSGNLGSATFSGTLARAPGQNVGSYSIDEGTLSLPAGYQITFVDLSLIITPATVTYVAKPATRVYGSGNPTFLGIVTGFVNGDTITTATTGTPVFTTTAIVNSPAGSYAINGSGLIANNGNYLFQQAASNSTALTITPTPTPTPSLSTPSGTATALNQTANYSATFGKNIWGPKIDLSIAGSTPAAVSIVPTNPAAMEAASELASFALDCATQCTTAPFNAGLNDLVTQVLVSSGVEPSLSSEPKDYRIAVAGGSLIVDVVVFTAAVAVVGLTAPEAAAVAGTAGLVYEVSELTIRPAVAQ